MRLLRRNSPGFPHQPEQVAADSGQQNSSIGTKQDASCNGEPTSEPIHPARFFEFTDGEPAQDQVQGQSREEYLESFSERRGCVVGKKRTQPGEKKTRLRGASRK